MTSIYDLSWGETSFLSKLALFSKSRHREKQNIRSNDRGVQASGYSALSSTYYSIVGTAGSQLKTALKPKWLAPVRMVMWGLTWLSLALWCYRRMLTLSNRVVELIGYEGMSADQCDVRQSILRRRGKYEEAKKCILVAFAKNPDKAHTRGLLHAGLAEIHQREGNSREAKAEVRTAIEEAECAESLDPRQASRIYRQCAEIATAIDNYDPFVRKLQAKARELARATSAKDQLLKM